LYCEGKPELLFTENETNSERVFGVPNASAYVKDGINDYIVQGRKEAVNPEYLGTKAAAHYLLTVGAGETKTVRLRLSDTLLQSFPYQGEPSLKSPPYQGGIGGLEPFGKDFDATFSIRQREADEFYQGISPFPLSEYMRNVQRQAFAGMLWSKQFYHYFVEDWLKGNRNAPPPPPERKQGRNHEWFHLNNEDILSGWTGLVAKLIQQFGEYDGQNQTPELAKRAVQTIIGSHQASRLNAITEC
jgi:hypothetical protein